jgi:pimeloyl-ACP methyl ester carboxylesterase
MNFKIHGNTDLPLVVLLHGGGLSWWSWQPVIDLLVKDYCVMTPIIDGHGNAYQNTFISIEHSAQGLLEELKSYHTIHAICGLSLGAQILTECLSQQPNLTKYAIIESSLVTTIPGIKALAGPSIALTYPLIKQKWFAKLQAQAMKLPDTMFDAYYQDSQLMSKSSLINLTVSNGQYQLKPALSQCQSKVLVVVGSQEVKLMRQSAQLLTNSIPNSKLITIPNAAHGDFSLNMPDTFYQTFKEWCQ